MSPTYFVMQAYPAGITVSICNVHPGVPMTPRNLLMASVASLGVASLAGAQTQPAGGQSPFWNGGADDSADTDERSVDFPTELAEAVAPAHEQFAGSRAALKAVEDQIDERLELLRSDFEESSAFREASTEQRESHIAREEAKRSALAELISDDDYNAARMLKDRLERDIRRAHEAGNVPQQRLLAMAELALSYGEQISRSERRLLDTDPAMIDARNRVRLANEQVSQLERGYEQSVRDDEALQVLRDQSRQLTIATEAAE
ncbi:MAG: hypothetical protein AAGK78_04100, partial [Planctomycetota bacterium]